MYTVRIKNRRSEKPTAPWDVPVDRTGKSPLGNSFIMSEESERDYVCDKYDAWFTKKVQAMDPRIMEELGRIDDIGRRYGKLNLFCWCAPKRCHAETVKKYLEDKYASD